MTLADGIITPPMKNDAVIQTPTK